MVNSAAGLNAETDSDGDRRLGVIASYMYVTNSMTDNNNTSRKFANS